MPLLLISVIVALAVGAVLSFVVCHSRHNVAIAASQVAASALEEKLRERDAALNERIAELHEAQSRVDQVRLEAKAELDRLHEEKTAAVEAKAKLEGEATSSSALKSQINEKEREIVRLNEEIARISGLLSDASARAEEIKSSCDNALAIKDKFLADQLCQKDESLCAQLEEKQKSIDEQKALLEQAEEKLAKTFDSLSIKALKGATDEFLKIASAKFETTKEEAASELKQRQLAIENLLKPVHDCLGKLECQCQEMEKKRVSAYDAVSLQIDQLKKETGQLSTALRRPSARGSWGEITLRTVAENAGLVEGQDFELQHSTDGDDGKLRADMVVRLPRRRSLVVDSKVPLDSYREAVATEDESLKQTLLANHAKLVRGHIRQLASKSYQDQYEGTDYVVMFLPAESIYQAALEFDSTLLEEANKHRVLLANPMTLVGLLRAVAVVLDQERLNENAQEVSKIGRNLYDGIVGYAGHVAKLGKNLKKSVETYNDSLGSLERMVLSRARSLKGKGVGGGGSLPELEDIEALPGRFRSSELSALPEYGYHVDPDESTKVDEDHGSQIEVR